jgi:hypothetical protein
LTPRQIYLCRASWKAYLYLVVLALESKDHTGRSLGRHQTGMEPTVGKQLLVLVGCGQAGQMLEAILVVYLSLTGRDYRSNAGESGPVEELTHCWGRVLFCIL